MGKTVLLITGGTGGHVFPAISLMKMNAELNYLVLLDHRTEWIVKKQKFKYIKVYSSKINLNLKLPLGILKIILGIIQSLFIIIKYKPDLAIGFGGYTSIPTILAARILNISTSTVSRWAKSNNNFPKPFLLGPNKVVWDRSEIDHYINEQKQTAYNHAPKHKKSHVPILPECWELRGANRWCLSETTLVRSQTDHSC